MTSSEKRKPKSTADSIRDPMVGLTEEQLAKLQQATGEQPGTYLAGTRFEKSQAQPDADSGMAPMTVFPDPLEGDSTFAFYPSSGDPSESHRPTIADAVIEHLRQARLRRQRPH